MKVLAIKKGSLQATEYNAVTNIAYAGGNVTISYGSSQTATLAYADYMLQIVL